MMVKEGTWNETCIRGRDPTAETISTLVCITTIRANVTHILARKHTPTQYSWFFARHYTNHNTPISTGNIMLRKQHAKAKATVGQALCCCVNHEYTIDLSSYWNKCRDHSMFWDQYLLQSHITRHADLYLACGRDRLHILKHCHGNINIRYSYKCQQARSLAMPWTLCRQTGKVKS